MRWQSTCALALVAFSLASTGCAEHLSLLERGAAGSLVHPLFWPPPSSTSIWAADAGEPATNLSFREVAERISSALARAGYHQARWYPVGADYIHGFALTTRLEQINDDATPKPARERWLSLYPEASDLFWLEGARDPSLPLPGRYRVLLVALTDLPIGPSHRAPRWNEETVMVVPGRQAGEFPSKRHVSRGYHVGVYVYEYWSQSADEKGAFVDSDRTRPAATQLQVSGLAALSAALSPSLRSLDDRP
jgi:hypothetical protein